VPIVGDGTNDLSYAALAELRDEIIPATVGKQPGLEANVTGYTAGSNDFNELMESRVPLVFAFVLGLAFLLLLATFRSIVIPIKAILLNLLSVGAAYGVVVWIFQEGNLESLLGFESPGAVSSWLPLFLFVLLFGLSMDYHVFILSRVREAFDRGMSTDEAVAHGIKSTAGVVTSAAIVMVAVFAIFATLSALEFKQMGVGLAVAVLIDATLIRGVLLPASMKLLGDWNWYLPRWLEWLPTVAPEEPARARTALRPTSAPQLKPSALDIDVEERGSRVHMQLSGELDLASAESLNQHLEQVEGGKPQLLVLDLRRLRFMDSTGLREIIGATRRAHADGRRVVLVKGPGPIDSVLDLTRVGDMLETVNDPATVGFPDDGGHA